MPETLVLSAYRTLLTVRAGSEYIHNFWHANMSRNPVQISNIFSVSNIAVVFSQRNYKIIVVVCLHC